MTKNFDLETFTFNGHPLRAGMLDGEPWFTGVDSAKCLALDTNSFATNVRRSLDGSEVRFLSFAEIQSRKIDWIGVVSPRGILAVSESGLYKIVLRAQRKNPAARDFQDWITKDVIRTLGLVPGGTAYDAAGEKECRVYFKRGNSPHVPPELLPALFPGKSSRVLLLSESGLYKIVLRAQRKNPSARETAWEHEVKFTFSYSLTPRTTSPSPPKAVSTRSSSAPNARTRRPARRAPR